LMQRQRMATHKAMAQGTWLEGAPPAAGCHVEQVVDPYGGAVVVGQVRHPGHKFGLALPDRPTDTWFRELAYSYLQALYAIVPRLMGPKVLAALDPSAASKTSGFGWLNTTWAVPALSGRQSANGSFWVYREDAGSAADSSLVLLAGRQIKGASLGANVGLRVVLQVHSGQAVICGVTLSSVQEQQALKQLPGKFKNPGAVLGQVKNALRQHFNLPADQWVYIKNLTRDERDPVAEEVRVQGHVYELKQATPKHTRGVIREFGVVMDNQPQVKRELYDRLQIARAGVVGDVFEQDAAAGGPAASLRERRSSRSEAQLQALLSSLQLNTKGGLAVKGTAANWFEVVGSRSAQGPQTVRKLKGSAVVTVAPPQPAPGAKGAAKPAPTPAFLFSDENAATQAFLRGWDLFARLQCFGFDPAAHFRFVKLPLLLRARAPFGGAPEGDRPAAEVRPVYGVGFEDARTNLDSLRPQLLVKFGSADPMQRRKVALPGEPDRVRAQYLGVAADPRWAWHEFGHVLAFASTGELEFEFAHSAGDALAAITSDPLSQLAADAGAGSLRYATFPWIAVDNRRHDRPGLVGYCWCGQRNRLRLDFSQDQGRQRHGYYEEQILSTSLFRLYRCLGGDTGNAGTATASGFSGDALTRLEAADYTTYLIMRAISLLGPAGVATARTPDQFVGALIDADLGTAAWHVQAPWPFAPYGTKPREMKRTGGRVHKVIRWAFEQQGLYATDDPKATADSLGLPPQVDVFLADNRLPGKAPPDGGYHPVALRAEITPAAPQPQLWLAHARTLVSQATGWVLTLQNRGAQATGAVVQVWTRSGATVGWTRCGKQQKVAQIQAGGSYALTLAQPIPGNAAQIFINLHAAADPSNLPLRSAPPKAMGDLMELVAHDNNLALIVRP
jgi:hypothetical protein